MAKTCHTDLKSENCGLDGDHIAMKEDKEQRAAQRYSAHSFELVNGWTRPRFVGFSFRRQGAIINIHVST